MNDYLWDRSGEPDEDIQKLEEILAPLGYQPKPLEIPASVQPAHRGRLFPALAIAATIALMALALGLWFNSYRSRAVAPSQANLAPVPVENGNKNGLQSTSSPETVAVPDQKPKPQLAVTDHRATGRRTLRTRSERRSGNTTMPQQQPEAIADARAEAEAAKEQLMVALRLVSSKLSLAQKRAQGGYPGNLMRNQHKVG
ncbi:MAG TPA: hypothetical protein VGJ55_07315 [Pyrinomonadaceae bacterium]|jgi:hypothetical protein